MLGSIPNWVFKPKNGIIIVLILNSNGEQRLFRFALDKPPGSKNFWEPERIHKKIE